jgi:hypothetical protein
VLATPRHGGRGGLYTAVTRSTQALALIHDRPLPSFYAGHPDLRKESADRFHPTRGRPRVPRAPIAVDPTRNTNVR